MCVKTIDCCGMLGEYWIDTFVDGDIDLDDGEWMPNNNLLCSV